MKSVTSTVPARRSTTPDLTSGDVGTRAQLARIIGQDGPITVAELAHRLDRTAAAIRRHLDAMLADGQVEARDLPGRRGRGRPAKAFVLTVTGHEAMPAGYDELAVTALRFLAEHGGPGAVHGFARQRSAQLAERLAPAVQAAGTEPAERVAALATALQTEGFSASVRPVAQGTPAQAVQLCQGHCPVQNVATEFPELCEAETQAFAELIGVDVRRLATLAAGGHVCTTHIPVLPRTSTTQHNQPHPAQPLPTEGTS